jgi:hypothetical protein
MTTTQTRVVIVGNPVDGIEIIGPFVTSEEAEVYVDSQGIEVYCWVVELVPPTYPE